MAYTVYILHSEQLNRFYTGKTSLAIEERLQYHLYHHKGFTAKAKDWKVIFTQLTESHSEAIKLEREIKKRGANRYLQSSSSKQSN